MISPITYEMYISKLVPVDIEETKIVLKTDTEFSRTISERNSPTP